MTENRIEAIKAIGLILICIVLFLYQSYVIHNEETLAQKTEEQQENQTETEEQKNLKYMDGNYQGSGMGFGGEIVVEVEIEEDTIINISIISAEKETPEYLQVAEKILEDIQKTQSVDVDVISGATFSSNGILDGVKSALEQAEQGKETEIAKTNISDTE